MSQKGLEFPVKNHKEAIKKATLLHRKGITIQEIAKALGVSSSKVQRWLVEAKFAGKPEFLRDGHLRVMVIPKKIYGNFEAIENLPAKTKGYLKCKVRCLLCKKIVVRKSSEVVHLHYKSCGCSRFNTGPESPNFRGFGEISRTFWSEIRNGALKKRRKRGFEFNINIRYIWELFLRQKRRCALTGEELVFARTSFGCNHGETTASLDRIDSKKGYVKGNVQWVHKDINIMKQSFKQRYFIERCIMVAKHAQRKQK